MKKLCHLSNNILIVSILLIAFFLPGAFSHCDHLQAHMYTPHEMEALIGSCVDIPCRFQTFPGFDSSKPIYGIWMKNEPVYDVGSSYMIFNSSGSINTYQMEMTGNLRRKNCSTRIPDLTADHADKYYFRVENGDTTATFCEDTFTLTVIDFPRSPSIVVFGSDLKEHQSLTITCSASTTCSRSPPELTWNLKKDSLKQILKKTDGTFAAKLQESITISDKHDGYNISCSATYPVTGGFKQADTVKTLSVSYAPKDTSASISPSGLVSKGSWVELSCSSRANPPITSFTWFKSSKHGAINVSEKQVYGFSATPTEEGDYYCETTNELGSENSTICIEITDPPLTPRINIPAGDLKEHQSVTVTCSASTPCPHSPPELTWNLQKDFLRQTEENTDGTFTTKIQENITLSDTHDGYKIRCSTRNPAARKSNIAEAEVTLNVSYAPRNTSASISPSGLMSEGSWVELSCSSRAKPPPRFTWFKKGLERITKVATGIFHNVQFRKGDQYFCVAANKLGEEKSSPINLRTKGTTRVGAWVFAVAGGVVMVVLCCAVFVIDKWFRRS
ncbi:myelin-associated glycoprotein-like [Poecilia reticulata]|uniref:myelin-associated glycoprotein-like n=1 Tax=Poecilia reticulata TaxID=8081 RepID=UPI0007EBDB4B|nr:PREDICTED: myelin-associated glycoprotein-like [Poecilia reticulata]